MGKGHGRRREGERREEGVSEFSVVDIGFVVC